MINWIGLEVDIGKWQMWVMERDKLDVIELKGFLRSE